MSEPYQRLTKILDKLYQGEELTIASLAKELHTSTKTIQRDLKEKLKSKFLIREGNRFRLKIQHKQQKDVFVINVLENLAQNIGGIFEKDVCEILDKYYSHSISFETPLSSITHKSKELLCIQKAIKNQVTLNLFYKNKKLCKIQPLELCVVKKSVYLCVLIDEQKRFLRLEDISQCTLGKQKTIPPSAHQEGQKVSLFVYPQASNYAQNIFWGEHQEIWKDQDGSLVVEFYCSNEEGLISEILSQIPHIMVLEPQNLKDRIERKILAYIKKQ